MGSFWTEDRFDNGVQVVTAFALAAHHGYTLVEMNKEFEQVVAGCKYRLELHMENGKGHHKEPTTIWQLPGNKFRLLGQKALMPAMWFMLVYN